MGIFILLLPGSRGIFHNPPMRPSRYMIPTLLSLWSTVLAGAAPQISLPDDLGRVTALPGPARRIVSLAPSITESLFAVGAGDQVVGVTLFCDYPETVRKIPHVGGMVNPNIEAIVALSPDLILVSMEGNTREDFTRLTQLGIPVFVTNPRTIAGIYRSLEQIGTLTGHAREARTMVDSMKTRVKTITAKVTGPSPRTLLVVSLQPLIAAGAGTFVNELLATAGAVNIAATARGTYPAYSREAILSANPDVLIITSDLLTGTESLTAMFPEWGTLPALRLHRVFGINPDIVSRPGPRAVDGLEQLYSLLHAGTP
jgi:iron complex transport system substrate-binding protein